MKSQSFDVAIVGGGAAGLSAALVLARSRRSVVVIDAGSPRNAPAAHMHNFLSRDGMPPDELLAAGRAEVLGYGGQVIAGTVQQAEARWGGFALTLADGEVLAARRLVVATGLTDELPDVPGVADRWGREVLHCPYCHGFEVRDQAIGVLASGPKSIHQALMVRQLSADVVFFDQGLAVLTDHDRERFAARGIEIVEQPVARLVLEDDRLSGVELADGSVVARQALFVGPRFVPNDALLRALGAETEQTPAGSVVRTDRYGKTSVAGLWSVGNVADLAAFVVEAASAGARAATLINFDLIEEDIALAVASREEVGIPVAAR